MADPVFLFNRAEMIVLVVIAALIGVLYGFIQKKRGKFDNIQPEE